MGEMKPADLRRVLAAAVVAFAVGVGILTLVAGYSSNTLVKVVQFLAVLGLGASVITGMVVLALVQLGDWRSPASEEDFETIVRRAEELARTDAWRDPDEVDEYADDGEVGWGDATDDHEFRALVRSALDELPLEFHRALEHVAVVVSDGGADVHMGGRRGAYGLYQGDTVTQDYFHDRIVIFRDTLVRDFGHDPSLLRAQVVRTVRHELAHHLGWDERGVRGLGL